MRDVRFLLSLFLFYSYHGKIEREEREKERKRTIYCYKYVERRFWFLASIQLMFI